MNKIKEKFFLEAVEEIKTKGHFSCSNPVLWNELYDYLKPQIPTLYKWEDTHFKYLNVIEKEQVDNIVSLIKTREKLKNDISNIEFILKSLEIDLKELGIE